MSVTDTVRLGRLDEIAPDGAKGFRAVHGGRVLELLVVRRDGRFYSYLNRCPHVGAPLDWVPGRFLTEDGSLIQCANHDARFRIVDGRCIQGPCPGRALTPVPVVERDGELFLASGAWSMAGTS